MSKIVFSSAKVRPKIMGGPWDLFWNQPAGGNRDALASRLYSFHVGHLYAQSFDKQSSLRSLVSVASLSSPR